MLLLLLSGLRRHWHFVETDIVFQSEPVLLDAFMTTVLILLELETPGKPLDLLPVW